MIIRLWRGWTSHENAATYQALLCTKVLPGIDRKQISGYLDAELLVPPEARRLLSRHDERSAHYEAVPWRPADQSR